MLLFIWSSFSDIIKFLGFATQTRVKSDSTLLSMLSNCSAFASIEITKANYYPPPNAGRYSFCTVHPLGRFLSVHLVVLLLVPLFVY